MAAVAAGPLRHYPVPWLQFPSLLTLSFTPRPIFFSSSRARVLRPSGPLTAEDDPADDEDAAAVSAGAPVKKSRNELKREARRAVRWGMELANFSLPQIQRVLRVASLEREVFEALTLVKRLGPDVREGRRRQFNYIGRLLRKAQPDLMDALIQASKDGDNSRLLALAGQESWSIENEEEGEEEEEEKGGEEIPNEKSCQGSDDYVVAMRWFDGLISRDPLITNEVYSVHNADFDRQELRKLVRKVQSVQAGQQADSSGAESNAMLTRVKKPLILFLRSLAKKTLADVLFGPSSHLCSCS
ncbi:uncharacterized protein LOC109714273 isoform X3 [Ananas comosus]|uniref:Uncharacterized protein LOC109714273 isoform X3 n=1 Tax=Ananas comosus TaxID=4615 RepID=A0A6P5FFQ9_ANACO|nr:uncharacterized protein LOC109714273 isoform X3 [Ananas comosus]